MIRALLGVAGVLVVGAALVAWLNLRGEDASDAPSAPHVATAESVARGEYLARIGNCAGCHTRRGGALFAGGRGIPTPFGIVYASNLTPDAETGLGAWTHADFWRALHNGRSRDGRWLYPAFPYPDYTQVTREDANALFDYLRCVPPVREANRIHELRGLYDSQAALAIWRALFFRPGVYEARPDRSAEWNRGAYLVRGLGHCAACHASRNVLGASEAGDELRGGLIPMQGWYAPSLASHREAGVRDWDAAHVVALLKHGISPRASVMGPMAEVVYRSTQHLSDADARAIATYLKSLPEAAEAARPVIEDPDPAQWERGGKIYGERCADCHGERGEGVAGMYPALAGNRAVLLDAPANTIRAVLSGGFQPGTAGNPRPFGMPPFAPFLSDDEIAAVVTYIRNAWGNRASAVQGWQVGRLGRGAARE